MGGPWFTVLRSGDDWQTVDTTWISNGHRQQRVEVQLRVRPGDWPPKFNPLAAWIPGLPEVQRVNGKGS